MTRRPVPPKKKLRGWGRLRWQLLRYESSVVTSRFAALEWDPWSVGGETCWVLKGYSSGLAYGIGWSKDAARRDAFAQYLHAMRQPVAEVL